MAPEGGKALLLELGNHKQSEGSACKAQGGKCRNLFPISVHVYFSFIFISGKCLLHGYHSCWIPKFWSMKSQYCTAE